VILPGADEDAAAELAERLRAGIAGAPVGGLTITMSFGVAAAAPGAFRWDDVYERADAALYRAKQDGRDRVRRDSALGQLPLLVA
jgi:diguanylate cyclase (GGDEF)-like protein